MGCSNLQHFISLQSSFVIGSDQEEPNFLLSQLGLVPPCYWRIGFLYLPVAEGPLSPIWVRPGDLSGKKGKAQSECWSYGRWQTHRPHPLP